MFFDSGARDSRTLAQVTVFVLPARWWSVGLNATLAFAVFGCGAASTHDSSGSAGGDGTNGGAPTTEPVIRGGYLDGRRLEARFWDGGDEARSFVEWFDRDLDAGCRFEADVTGQQRCFPQGGGTVLYADAACQQPLVYLFTADTPNPGAIREPLGCADAPARGVFRVGASVTAPDVVPTYERAKNGTCHAITSLGGPALHTATALSLDELVAANEVRVPAANGTTGSAVILQAADGAREVRAVDLGEPFSSCSFDPLFEPETGPASLTRATCVPTDIAEAGPVTDYFADSTCTQAVFTLQTNACRTPRFARLANYTPCGRQHLVHEVGAAKPAQQTFYTTQTGAGCTPSSPPVDPASLYAPGASFDAGSLPQLERHDWGSGRLRVPLATVRDGVVAKPWLQVPDASGAAPPVFYDTHRTTICRPLHAADGTLRCLPQGLAQRTQALFAEATCQTPVTLAGGSGGGCAGPSLWVEVNGMLSADATLTSLYEAVGDPYSSLVYERLPGGCVAYTGQKSAEPLQVSTLQLVPPSDFAEVQPPR